MKKSPIVLALIFAVTIFSCTESPKENTVVSENVSEITTAAEIPFKGTWSRAFSMGEGMDQVVSYSVGDAGILYKMVGAMPMEYTLEMDVFVAEDNRWVGKRGEDTYVVFVKNITDKSISLFKQKAENKEQALIMDFPSDTTRSKFTSWNVYERAE